MPNHASLGQETRIRDPWVEVHLDELQRNIESVRAVLRPDTAILFVVKANAYGHGLVPVATRAAEAGINWFAVAYLREAVALRRALPDADILILGVVAPEDVRPLIDLRLTAIVTSREHGLALAAAARAAGGIARVHLKVDTGMARLGVPWEEGRDVLRALCQERGLDVHGLCSHFATVEPDLPESAQKQYERFAMVADAAPKRLFKHLSSSRAFLYHPEWDLDAVRPGIALYGYGAGDERMRVAGRPVLQWKSSVVQVKAVAGQVPVGYYGTYTTTGPTHLGIVAAGYADGYLRTLSNRGHVLVRGHRCRVVGRVTMNWLTVDLGPETNVRPGDEVVLIGRQGEEAIWASELAKKCRTIPYEILTMINPLLERKYL